MQPNHFQLNVEQVPPPNGRQIQWDDLNENGHGLTVEQEQSADELIADIQRSVDEMLMGFQNSPLVSPEPPSPANVSNVPVGLLLNIYTEKWCEIFYVITADSARAGCGCGV